MESDPANPNAPINSPTINEISLLLEDYAIEDVHEILIRNGLYLPSRGGHWVTKKVMIAMYKGEIHCPYFGDLKPRPCPKPPSRQLLVEEVNKEIMRKYRDKTKCLKTNGSRMPEVKWLLDVLSSLNQHHQFFKKGYMPERQLEPTHELKVAYLRQQMDLTLPVFFDLPISLLIRRKSLKTIAPSSIQQPQP